jgi:hypothetical protein
MTVQRHLKLDLAASQLETAIGLFVSGRDKFSVITLAGAADGILSQLVVNKNGKNFADDLLEDEEDKTLTRATLTTHINDMIFINALKHMDEDDDGDVVMDIDSCALTAILKALANFVELRGKDVHFVKAFLAWVKLNLDPNVYNVDCDPNWTPSGKK